MTIQRIKVMIYIGRKQKSKLGYREIDAKNPERKTKIDTYNTNFKRDRDTQGVKRYKKGGRTVRSRRNGRRTVRSRRKGRRTVRSRRKWIENKASCDI